MSIVYNVIEINKGRKILHETCSSKKMAEAYKEKKIKLYKDHLDFKDSSWIVEEYENDVATPERNELSRVNLFLDRSALEQAQKKAIKNGVELSKAGNASAFVRFLVDSYNGEK